MKCILSLYNYEFTIFSHSWPFKNFLQISKIIFIPFHSLQTKFQFTTTNDRCAEKITTNFSPYDLTQFQLQKLRIRKKWSSVLQYYLTSSRRESISPVVRRQCWIEVGRGGWASFDEDSPIKDTKGNHEEIPAILNRLILTNVRATLYSFLAFLNNGDSL